MLVIGALVFTLADGDDADPSGTAPAGTTPSAESTDPATWRLGYDGFGPITWCRRTLHPAKCF